MHVQQMNAAAPMGSPPQDQHVLLMVGPFALPAMMAITNLRTQPCSQKSHPPVMRFPWVAMACPKPTHRWKQLRLQPWKLQIQQESGRGPLVSIMSFQKGMHISGGQGCPMAV